ncbi:hypothetical protein BH20BAC1_BH20BAC1_20790 [soil metagenome]
MSICLFQETRDHIQQSTTAISLLLLLSTTGKLANDVHQAAPVRQFKVQLKSKVKQLMSEWLIKSLIDNSNTLFHFIIINDHSEAIAFPETLSSLNIQVPRDFLPS